MVSVIGSNPRKRLTLRIVSSLALPNLFLIGLGDSLPLFVPLVLFDALLLPDEFEPNLCGKVLDFSQGRCLTSSEPTSDAGC